MIIPDKRAREMLKINAQLNTVVKARCHRNLICSELSSDCGLFYKQLKIPFKNA